MGHYRKGLCDSYHAYVFTGATILDIADFEHYPFVTLGKYHFWDDPIYKYAAIVGKTKSTSFDKKMREQIIETINDNIRIFSETVEAKGYNITSISIVRYCLLGREIGFKVNF